MNNLKYADNPIFKAENEELKSLLMKVEEESEQNWPETQHSKTYIMASGPITSC